MMRCNLHDPGAGPLAAVLLATLLLADAAAAADRWHCTAASASAYRQDARASPRERWLTLVVPVTDQDFLVSRTGSTGGWQVTRAGDDLPVLACASAFDPAGVLSCGADGQFEMNRITLTFSSHLFRPGNLVLQDAVAATATGRCEPL